jgi:hypothetical protein
LFEFNEGRTQLTLSIIDRSDDWNNSNDGMTPVAPSAKAHRELMVRASARDQWRHHFVCSMATAQQQQQWYARVSTPS